MDSICHRCGTAINSSELFCPHCGAPQLRYEPSDEVTQAGPLSSQSIGRDPSTVLWKDVIASAVLVAIPVGVLTSLLDFGALWVIGGGIATVSIYRRRTGRPPASGTGWRIGALLGVMAAFASTAFDGLTLVVQRYWLHDGGVIDGRFHQVGQQLTEQLSRSNPEAAAVMPWFVHFWLTPDGAAAIALMGAVGSAIAMLLFSAAGGAIGARIASLGNRAERSS
ncbi:drug/metabolite transporter (DMT)-like permease [Silvibacterium bohemicum]|uniref:Drug/metabolite transporter (DMT)-like permease n=1 Tax=Silvibacterium bohemicum TaxID=1577686 RepID=A0A841K8J8_9BACT|nr:zinc-ribbon domain-containing protein [Silvibacterium bohemicum]MBB6146888.1 drug/metabolite transporter (DMT)-like permease [Silvibacterium bohemicum]